jgi:hypothetical protein
MALKAGTTGDTSDSMAAAIEHAFRSAWPAVMTHMDLPSTTSPDLQLLFVAIAQGVVHYLTDHASSFQVSVTVAADHTATATVTIATTGQLYP